MPTHLGKIHIQAWIARIDESDLSVRQYLSRHKVPFSQAQYYRYKKKLEQEGGESLTDGRTEGNNRRITAVVEGFIRGYVSGTPEATLSEIQREVKERFHLELSEAGISRCLKRLGQSRIDKPHQEKIERTYTMYGGFEIISSLACHMGWPHAVSAVIEKRIKQVKKGALWEKNQPETAKLGRNKLGQFTSNYNRRRVVREKRFGSLESKREEKNFRSMSISTAGPLVLARKSLAMLALPLVTNNGMVRSVDTPSGDALRCLCGYNYLNSELETLHSIRHINIDT